MRYLNSSMSLMAASLALALASARIVNEDTVNKQTVDPIEDREEPGPVSRQVRRQMERKARKGGVK